MGEGSGSLELSALSSVFSAHYNTSPLHTAALPLLLKGNGCRLDGQLRLLHFDGGGQRRNGIVTMSRNSPFVYTDDRNPAFYSPPQRVGFLNSVSDPDPTLAVHTSSFLKVVKNRRKEGRLDGVTSDSPLVSLIIMESH